MKKISLLIMVGLVAGSFMSWLFHTNSRPQVSIRNPAGFAWQGKHQRLFNIQIVASRGLPTEDDKDLVLKAQVIPMFPLKGEFHYQWILPEGAHVVDGQVEDSVVGLTEGQFLEKEITLQGISQEGINKIVTLQVWTDVDGVKMGGAGVFATKPNEIQMNQPTTQMKTLSTSPQGLPGFIQQ